MKRIIIAVSLAVFPFMSGAVDYVAYAQDHNHEHSHQASETTAGKLSLDHGKRWQMDEHTRILLIEMEKTFYAADHSSRTGLNAAGVSLKGQLDQLITGCAMAGKAHDQLHIFLTEFILANERLVQAGDYAMARNAAIALKGHFGTYKKYFK